MYGRTDCSVSAMPSTRSSASRTTLWSTVGATFGPGLGIRREPDAVGRLEPIDEPPRALDGRAAGARREAQLVDGQRRRPGRAFAAASVVALVRAVATLDRQRTALLRRRRGPVSLRRRVVEERRRRHAARLAVNRHLELVRGQPRHGLAVPVDDVDVDGDEFDGGPEGGRLLGLRTRRLALPPCQARTQGDDAPPALPTISSLLLAPHVRLPGDGAVALPRADTNIFAGDLDAKRAPSPVARQVVRHVSEQVLVRQFLEDLGEHLRRACRRCRRRRRGRRSSARGAPSIAFRRREPRAPGPGQSDRARRRCDSRRRSATAMGDAAVEVLAVGEHDQRPAPGLAAELVDRLDDDVVERGAAPGREAVDGPQARGQIDGRPGQREDVVVERRAP